MHPGYAENPDHVAARADINDRQAWADYVTGYGGVRFSGDRLDALDARGLELTRRVLSTPG